jgi:hypothetical protein
VHLAMEQVVVPTSPARLRCVWIASEDEYGTHLTARWVDDRPERDEARLLAGPGFGEKGGETCWHITLYFVWDSR